MQQKFNDQFTQQHQNSKNKEGDITIEGKKIMLNQKIIM